MLDLSSEVIVDLIARIGRTTSSQRLRRNVLSRQRRLTYCQSQTVPQTSKKRTSTWERDMLACSQHC